MSAPDVRVTRYAVSCVPPDDINAYHFTLTVELRDVDRWAVLDGGFCVGKRGNRSYESQPSSRTDRFKNAYRFDLDTALEIAKREAPKMTVNGHTVAAVLARTVQPSQRVRGAE